MAQPWEVGTEDERWLGYLDPTTGDPRNSDTWQLRNLVGARTYDELRDREDFRVEARAIQRWSQPQPEPRTYDLDHLKAIHKQLFQDVYAWAGQLRTVGIGKGTPFADPDQAEAIMSAVAETVRDSDRLRSTDPAQVPAALARIYNVVNIAHPFREGNGRTQREFMRELAAESGHAIDWTHVHGSMNDHASSRARKGDLAPLTTMFARIVTRAAPAAPPPRLPGAVSASYPNPAAQATSSPPTPPAQARPYRPPGRGPDPGPQLGR